MPADPCPQVPSGHYAWLTPPDPAAIAILRCQALPALIDRPLPDRGRARFARLIDAGGRMVDEVVVCHLDSGQLELATHGGVGVRLAVDQCLGGHGLLPVAAAPDPYWNALAAAPSPAAVRWLLTHPDQQPDFPAIYLRRQPVVLITGPANAGKSTLLNAWCGHQRALVADVPGTTRDLVTAQTLVHGWRLRLVDSAGLRATADPLEAAGQALVERARATADVVLHLLPAGTAGAAAGNDLVVIGKADLAADGADLAAGPLWSAVGLPGRTPAALLDDLSRNLLRRLGLPPVD